MQLNREQQRVRVGVRVRPSAEFAQDALQLDPTAASVTVRIPHNSRDVVNNKREEWRFNADWVAANASQGEVYDALAREAVERVLAGRSATILAYGQTGSGKSYTMLGDARAYRNRGVTPRALADLLAGVAARPELECCVTVSQCELYLDSVADLLERSAHVAALAAPLVARYRLDVAASGGSALHPPELRLPGGAADLAHDLAIVDDPLEGVTIRGLTQVPVYCEEDALSALFAGEAARVTARHSLNKRSSRGHSVFTVTLRQRTRLGCGRELVTVSKLTLVDLAGSERLQRTHAGAHAPGAGGAASGGGALVGVPTTSARQHATGGGGGGGGGALNDPRDALLYRESVSINKSLGYLEQCVAALRHSNRPPQLQPQRRASAVAADGGGSGGSGGGGGGGGPAPAGASPTRAPASPFTATAAADSSTASAFAATARGPTGSGARLQAGGGGGARRLRSTSLSTPPPLASSAFSSSSSAAAAAAPAGRSAEPLGGAAAPPLIPFRQSKLTSLLRDCFGGGTATVFIACICAEAGHINETLTTLRLAQRMSRLSSRPAGPRTHVDGRVLASKQSELIRSLTRELAMHDAIAGRTGVAYDEYTPEQRAGLTERLRAYVGGGGGGGSGGGGGGLQLTAAAATAVAPLSGRGSPEFPLVSVREMHEALRVARQLVHEAGAAAEQRVRSELLQAGSHHAGGPRGGSAAPHAPSHVHAPLFPDPLLPDGDDGGEWGSSDGLGELDARVSGVAVGHARDDDAPHSLQAPPAFAARATARRQSVGGAPAHGVAAPGATHHRPSVGGGSGGGECSQQPFHTAPVRPQALRRASMPAGALAADGGGGTHVHGLLADAVAAAAPLEYSSAAAAAGAATQRQWNRWVGTPGLGAAAAAALDALSAEARGARAQLADAAQGVSAARSKVEQAQRWLHDADAAVALDVAAAAAAAVAGAVAAPPPPLAHPTAAAPVVATAAAAATGAVKAAPAGATKSALAGAPAAAAAAAAATAGGAGGAPAAGAGRKGGAAPVAAAGGAAAATVATAPQAPPSGASVSATPLPPTPAPPAGSEAHAAAAESLRAELDRASAAALASRAHFDLLHAAFLVAKRRTDEARARVAAHTAAMLDAFQRHFAGHHGGMLPTYAASCEQSLPTDAQSPRAAAADTSQLDAKEAFDEIERCRVAQDDPRSVAFFKAIKSAIAARHSSK